MDAAVARVRGVESHRRSASLNARTRTAATGAGRAGLPPSKLGMQAARCRSGRSVEHPCGPQQEGEGNGNEKEKNGKKGEEGQQEAQEQHQQQQQQQQQQIQLMLHSGEVGTVQPERDPSSAATSASPLPPLIRTALSTSESVPRVSFPRTNTAPALENVFGFHSASPQHSTVPSPAQRGRRFFFLFLPQLMEFLIL